MDQNDDIDTRNMRSGALVSLDYWNTGQCPQIRDVFDSRGWNNTSETESMAGQGGNHA
ncbi:MAG: hypothetical protein AAF387_14640 [Pseudomonadota bacterium]